MTMKIGNHKGVNRKFVYRMKNKSRSIWVPIGVGERFRRKLKLPERNRMINIIWLEKRVNALQISSHCDYKRSQKTCGNSFNARNTLQLFAFPLQKPSTKIYSYRERTA